MTYNTSNYTEQGGRTWTVGGSLNILDTGSLTFDGSPFRSGAPLVVASSTYVGAAEYRCDGTNDQEDIQRAIDSLGSGGGVVVLTYGTYALARAGTVTGDTLTTPYCILLDASDGPVALVGMPGATKFRLTDSQPTNTISVLVRGSSGTKRTNATDIFGIEFYSNPATQTAWTDFGMVEVAYSDNVTIAQCYFHDSPFLGAQVFRNSQNSVFCNNRMTYSAYGNGYRIENLSGMVYCNVFDGDPAVTKACLDLSCNSDISIQGESIQVFNNLFKSGYILISLAGQKGTIIQGNELRGATNSNSIAIAVSHYGHISTPFSCVNCSILDNIIIGCRQGIIVTGTVANGVTGLIVEGNQVIEDTSAVNLANGITEQDTATVGKNIFRNNRVVGATTTFSFAGAPTNGTRHSGNLGYNDSVALVYCDENNGTGTIANAATSVVITHGLGWTPQARNITITPTNSPTNDPGNMWVSSITSTQFTVNCRADPGASTLTFDWQIISV